MVERTWTTPELIELNMSAEIGAYQDEYEGERDPRFVRREQATEPTGMRGSQPHRPR